MSSALLRSTFAALVVTLTGFARAEESAGPAIYQQRNADGSVLLTDRPSAGAVTQRTWRLAPEDPGAAQRRESARLEAAEVSRRIGRKLESDDRRAQELTLARMRAAELQARREAEVAEAQPLWLVAPRIRVPQRPDWQVPPPSSNAPFTRRPPTASIVRGVPMSAEGFPIR